MNSAAKGTRLEKEFEDYLQALGYLTHRAKRTAWQANDIWGCHDVMARHKNRPNRLLYFQVSTEWRLNKREDCRLMLYGRFEYAYLVTPRWKRQGRKHIRRWIVRPLIKNVKEWGDAREHKGEIL